MEEQLQIAGEPGIKLPGPRGMAPYDGDAMSRCGNPAVEISALKAELARLRQSRDVPNIGERLQHAVNVRCQTIPAMNSEHELVGLRDARTRNGLCSAPPAVGMAGHRD